MNWQQSMQLCTTETTTKHVQFVVNTFQLGASGWWQEDRTMWWVRSCCILFSMPFAGFRCDFAPTSGNLCFSTWLDNSCHVSGERKQRIRTPLATVWANIYGSLLVLAPHTLKHRPNHRQRLSGCALTVKCLSAWYKHWFSLSFSR